MAITVTDFCNLDTFTSTTATGSHSLFTVPVGVLNFVVVQEASIWTSPGGSVTDQQGNIYTRVPGALVNANNVPSNGFLQLFSGYIARALTSGQTITYTYNQVSPAGINAFSFFVTGGISAVDAQVKIAFGTGTTPTMTGIPARPGFQMLGLLGYNGGQSYTADAGDGWTDLNSFRGSVSSVDCETQICGATPLTFAPTLISGSPWGLIVAAVQPAIPWAATLL